MPAVPANPPSVQPELTTAEGVTAMIPVANITLEDALLDNPNFRANIKLFEGQVFYIENWLVDLVNAEMIAMKSSQYTIPAMKLVGEAFRTTLALKDNYISEVNEKVLKPLNDFLKTDLKDFKDSKKVYDKALEKYESTLAKYNGQSRQKEPSALREEAFQLYDTRKAYIQAAMSCSMLCIRLQDGLDQLVLGVFLDLIATQHDYFSGNADHFGSMALQVLQFKTYMKDHKEASTVTLQELEQNKERYTADAIEYWKPSRSLKCYTNNAPATKSTIGHAALGPAFAAQMAGQVPISTLMARPATISQFPATGNRTHMPIPQFQTHQALQTANTFSFSGDKSAGSVSVPLENNPVNADALTTDTTIDRINSGPSLSLPNSSTQQIMSNSIIPSTSTVLDNSTPTTKQGYLNIRIPQPRNRAPVWQRKYFFIQEGEFGFESVVSNPTVGSQVVQSERIAVLLCEVRYGSSYSSMSTLGGTGNLASGSQGLAMVQMERRFCFEVVCATQSYLLQAETEDDLMSWVNTFEAAKRDALLQQNLPRPVERDEPYSPMIPDTVNSVFTFSEDGSLGSQGSTSNNGTEEAKPSGSLGLGWAANVPGVSLLLGSINPGVGRTSPTSDLANAEKTLKQSDPTSVPPEITMDTEASKAESESVPAIDTSAPALSQQTKDGPSLPPVLNTENLPPPRSRSVAEVITNPDQPTGHSQQLSEIEKLMTSSLHLVPRPTHLPVSE
ncbi:SNF1-interacting protein [Haplosporangium sp. Z 11]|nr:SNF1-interacting protein [Haplosporangium sp. Z 11]